jgi:hypothetical protein
MSLKTLLEGKKATILEKWFDLVLEVYPAETQRFLKKQKSRFANPVAHEISLGLEGILDQLLRGGKPTEVSPLLDRIVRIRAVQELAPSQALAFIFDLRRLLREELADKAWEGKISEEMMSLEREIDQLALLSLDIYMKCREEIFELRVAEVKNRVGKLLERANLLGSIPEHEGEHKAVTDKSLS